MLGWLMNMGFAGGTQSVTPTGVPCGPGYMPLMSSDGSLLIDSGGNYICVAFSVLPADRSGVVRAENRFATVPREDRTGRVLFENRMGRVRLH